MAAGFADSAGLQRKGYQNFGSFHTDNVEVLIRQEVSDYKPPNVPEVIRSLRHDTETVELGVACRGSFLIDFDTWSFLNHGAFGAPFRRSFKEAQMWRELCELQPLRFLDRELFPQLVEAIRDLATFINCRPQDVVLVPNATTGLNAVVNSVPLSSEDCIYLLDIGYGSVKKMAQEATARAGAQLVVQTIPLPVSCADDIVQVVAAGLPDNTKLAIFDAVTSNTALVLPLQQLIAICKARGIQVLVDGAHAPGMLDLDVDALGADYLVGNCHKWLCAPRGCALMWVAAECQHAVKPALVSHGSGSGFLSAFIWDGNRDYSPYLALPSALQRWRVLGPQRVRMYCRQLLDEAVQLLTTSWRTALFAPLEMCAFMALVRLPPLFGVSSGQATSTDAKFVQDSLHLKYQIEVPVKCVVNELYVRISAFVYNQLMDYQVLANAVREMQTINPKT